VRACMRVCVSGLQTRGIQTRMYVIYTQCMHTRTDTQWK